MSSTTLALNPQVNNGLTLPTKEEVLKKISSERTNIVTELKNKMQATKFQLLKQYLVNEKIYVPDSIKTVEKLLKYVEKNLTKEQYAIVLEKKKSIDKSIEGMLNDLSKGSSTAFSVRIKEILKSVKSIGLAIAKPLALRTVLTFLTPPPLQIFANVGFLAYSGYKLVKNSKARNVVNEEYAISKMIRELEITKDKNGKIIDTRFSSSIQEKIREFLKENNIKFQDTGYISLMNTIYSLDASNKMKLCNFINNSMGNVIDVKERLKKYKGNFFQRLSRTFAPTTQLAGVGLDLADTINDSVVLRTTASSLLGGFLTLLTTKNEAAAAAVAGGNVAASVVVYFTGYGADIVGGIQKIINKTGFALIFGAVGVLGSGIMALWDYVKGKKMRVENALENKTIRELEQKLYANEIKEEKEKVKRIMIETPDLAQIMIVSIVCEFMIKRGIEIPKNISNVEDLVSFIKSLDKAKSKDILKFYDDLTYFNEHNHSVFMKRVVQAINTICEVATIGLAGFSLYDMFKDISAIVKSNNETDVPVDAPIDSNETNADSPILEFQGSGADISVEYYGNRSSAYDSWDLFQKSEGFVKFGELTNEECFQVLCEAIAVRNYAQRGGNIDPNINFVELLSKLSPKRLSEFIDYCKSEASTVSSFGYDELIIDIDFYGDVIRELDGYVKVSTSGLPHLSSFVSGATGVEYSTAEKIVNGVNDIATDASLPVSVIVGTREGELVGMNATNMAHFTREEGRDSMLHRLSDVSVDESMLEQKTIVGRSR